MRVIRTVVWVVVLIALLIFSINNSELQSHHDIVCRLLLEKKSEQPINTPGQTY